MAEDDCPSLDLPAMRYERGPTDKNDAMFDIERKMADDIATRCGKATSPQSGMADDMSKSRSFSPGS